MAWQSLKLDKLAASKERPLDVTQRREGIDKMKRTLTILTAALFAGALAAPVLNTGSAMAASKSSEHKMEKKSEHHMKHSSKHHMKHSSKKTMKKSETSKKGEKK